MAAAEHLSRRARVPPARTRAGPAAGYRGLPSVRPTSCLDWLAFLLIRLESIRYARRRAEIFAEGPQGDRPSGAFRVVRGKR